MEIKKLIGILLIMPLVSIVIALGVFALLVCPYNIIIGGIAIVVIIVMFVHGLDLL